jgi:hypothetical protein
VSASHACVRAVCAWVANTCVLCARGWRTRACCVRVGGEQCTRAHFVMKASHISANSFEQSRQQSACDYAAMHATHGAVLEHTVHTIHLPCNVCRSGAHSIQYYSVFFCTWETCSTALCCSDKSAAVRCPCDYTSTLVIVSCCYGNAKQMQMLMRSSGLNALK